ncbi:ciliary microtubule inner protein 3 [Phascolarctos cinereus]
MPYMLPRRIRVPLKAKQGNKPQLRGFRLPDKQQDPTYSHRSLAFTTLPVVVDPWKQQQKVINHRFHTQQYTNSYTPFYTLEKPTCGYLYCRDTDHTRKRLDVPYTNVTKWRTDAIL